MKNVNEKIDNIFKELEDGVRTIFESDKYKHYLEVMSRFYNYSANNCRLILNQCPHATKVAGYRQWQKNFNRYVKKDEKAIRIIAPHKDYGFIEVCVFDISQTDGAPLPNDGIVAYKLNSNIKNYDILFKSLSNISPLPIYFEELNGPNGICILGKEIKINTGMSEAQNLKTLIHEIAHAILHNNSNTSRRTQEVEAESVAFAVCAYLGIDTSSYSFGYIASYSRGQSTKILMESLNTITHTTNFLIRKIRKELGLPDEDTSLTNDIAQSLNEKNLELCNSSKVNVETKLPKSVVPKNLDDGKTNQGFITKIKNYIQKFWAK
ncbi:MAG: ImmA/IrrE family metallo-endopeptidase [Phascolarctobacterium sp.]|nr:ImmA/IrrE family metallo-endopeptidase [Phascolarctobacterium sp.]